MCSSELIEVKEPNDCHDYLTVWNYPNATLPHQNKNFCNVSCSKRARRKKLWLQRCTVYCSLVGGVVVQWEGQNYIGTHLELFNEVPTADPGQQYWNKPNWKVPYLTNFYKFSRQYICTQRHVERCPIELSADLSAKMYFNIAKKRVCSFVTYEMLLGKNN